MCRTLLQNYLDNEENTKHVWNNNNDNNNNNNNNHIIYYIYVISKRLYHICVCDMNNS